jgi:hypothetical protein
MNNGLIKIWKEAVLAKFKVLSRNLPEGTEKNHENLSQDRRSPSRDLNPGPAEYETGVLTTRWVEVDLLVVICEI